MNPDVSRGLLVLLAFVLLGASVGAYDAARFRERDLAWTSTSAVVGTLDGELEEGASAEARFLVAGPGVERVAFRLTWTDDVGAPDGFTLRAAGPQGQTAATEVDGSGDLALEIPVATPPAQVAAPNDAAARHLAALLVDPVSGVGEWVVTVTLEAAPGSIVPVAGAQTQADGANGWTLEARVTTYAPGP